MSATVIYKLTGMWIIKKKGSYLDYSKSNASYLLSWTLNGYKEPNDTI